MLKFMYSEKATKFCKISTVDLTDVTQDKYLMEMLQKIVAFSEYMKFKGGNIPNLIFGQNISKTFSFKKTFPPRFSQLPTALRYIRLSCNTSKVDIASRTNQSHALMYIFSDLCNRKILRLVCLLE